MTATAEAQTSDIVLAQPLAPATQGAPGQAEQQSLYAMARQIASSRLVVPALREKPDDVMLILLIARDLRLAPTMALSRIHIVEGKPTLAAETMRGIVQRAGHHIHFEEMGGEQVTIVGWRAGEQDWPTKVTWSKADALQAGLLNKGTWKAYTRAMLTARATSELCRAIFADVLMGMTYAPEDFDSTVDGSGQLVNAPSEPLTQAVDAEWFRSIVLEAFDGQDHPSGHPYDGITKPVDRLRRLWSHCRDNLHVHLEDVKVRGLDGQPMDAYDFYSAAGKAATAGEPFEDAASAPQAPQQQPQAPAAADTAEDAAEAEIEPDAEPAAAVADDDAVDAEVVEPVDQHAGFLAELQWCAAILQQSPETLTRRQREQHQVETVEQLSAETLAQIVSTLRKPSTGRLMNTGHEEVAAAYEQRIAATIAEPGRPPVDVSDLQVG